MKGETDEKPEVTTEGSCSGFDVSISGTLPAFRTRSWSSACGRLHYYTCQRCNDDIITNRTKPAAFPNAPSDQLLLSATETLR